MKIIEIIYSLSSGGAERFVVDLYLVFRISKQPKITRNIQA